MVANLKILTIIVVVGLIAYNIIHPWNLYKEKCQEVETYEQLIEKYQEVASMPPDTVIKETVIYKDTVIKVVGSYQEPPAETAKFYEDSLVTNDIHVKVGLWADNLYKLDWTYSPVRMQISKEIYLPTPVPVIQEKIVERAADGIFVTFGLGFSDRFVGKAGINYLTPKQHIIGGEYIRFGDKSIIMFNYGIKLKL